MRTFHTGGVATKGGEIKGFDYFQQLIKSPKNIPHRAVIAVEDGRIDKIEKSAAGGHYIHVAKKKYFAEPTVDVTVKVGQNIKRGDVLTTGTPSPRDVMKATGVKGVREHLVNELDEIYSGRGIETRYFELLSKKMTERTKVKYAGDSGFVPGDVVDFNKVRNYNKNPVIVVKVKDAKGKQLGEDIAGLKRGKKLSKIDVDKLKLSGIRDVKVYGQRVRHTPVLKGMEQVGKIKGDWLAQMGSTGLKRNIIRSSAHALKSDIHGIDPLPGYVYGAEFGVEGAVLKAKTKEGKKPIYRGEY